MYFEAQEISKSFGTKKVLQGISFSVESGSALGLLGRNGAGKTTSIRILMGVFNADSGKIMIDHKPIDRKKINIGYLPEERGLYPKKPILEQLAYFGQLRGMSSRDAKASGLKWLKRLEMDEYALKRLDTLSKGNQQKIQLAQALITNPDLVILDEPFSGLDPVNAMLLKEVVQELIHSGKIVLFSSHQMSYIEEFCERISILNKGKIVLAGEIKAIKRNYNRNKLVVSALNAESVKRAVQEQLGALTKELSLKNGELFVTLHQAEDKNRFMAQLAALNLDIDGVKVFEPSLNDIFVEYTEEL